MYYFRAHRENVVCVCENWMALNEFQSLVFNLDSRSLSAHAHDIIIRKFACIINKQFICIRLKSV